MDNPEKLATQDTHDEDKQNKNTTQYTLNTTSEEFVSNIMAMSRYSNNTLK